LTFNATCLNLLGAGRLFRWYGPRPPAELARHLLVTPMINGMLTESPRTPLFPVSCATEVAGWYVRGWLMRVALSRRDGGYRKGMEPILERLGNIDEVWAMCFRKPAPGWRFLGRFVEYNTFVALRAYDRRLLSPPSRYLDAANQVIADWHELFGRQSPHRGDAIEEYLGGQTRDANEED
jgi:hypothetical protein